MRRRNRQGSVHSAATSPRPGGIDTAIDRIEAIGGDCVQVFTQSPRMWRPTAHKPEAIERFKARRARSRDRRRRLPRALPLQPRGAGRRDLREVGRDDAARRSTPPWRSRPTASSSTSARTSAPGFDARPRARRAGAARRSSSAATATRGSLIENSAGAGGTIGRSLDELATLVDALGRHPRLGICLDSCHLYASGYDVTDPRSSTRSSREVDATIGLDRLRALHVNDSATPLGSNRDRHANILEGELGEGLGAFLAHPAFQELAAYLEVAGAGQGPTARAPQAATPRALDGENAATPAATTAATTLARRHVRAWARAASGVTRDAARRRMRT